MLKLIYTRFSIAALCFNCIFAAMVFAQDSELQKVFEQTDKLEEQADFKTLQKVYDSIIEVSIRQQDTLTQAFFTRLKGRGYMHEDKYDVAMNFAQEARELAISINNDSILGLSLLNMASIYRQTGEKDSALQYYSEALRIFKETNDTLNIADVLHGLMIYYNTTDEFGLALEAGLKSNFLFKKLNKTKNYIQSLNDVANIYKNLGAYDTAFSCYEEVYEMSLENDMPRTAATALNNMGVIYYYKGNFEASKEFLLRAIEFNESIGDKGELAMLYANISIIYDKEGEKEKEISALEKSLAFAFEINNHNQQLITLEKLGKHYYDEGNYKLAESYFLQSMARAQNARKKETSKKISLKLADIYTKQNALEKAVIYYQLAVKYQDSLINSEKARIIENALSNNRALVLNEMITEIHTSHNQELKRITTRSMSLIYTFIGIAVILAVLLIFFRMRAKKNRIIAEQKIQQLEDEKKLMRARSVLIGQENERKRIAHDLHDGIGVLLSTASLKFSQVKFDESDTENTELVEKANKLIKEASVEVRKISKNMMPGVLSKLGLRDALEELFESVNEIEGIATKIVMNCDRKRLPENTEIMIFRIVQELVNNTIKHARASEIIFDIQRNSENIHLMYEDNGVGFELQKIIKTKCMGLSGIRSRVDFLHGELEINTSPDDGTRYELIIPI